MKKLIALTLFVLFALFVMLAPKVKAAPYIFIGSMNNYTNNVTNSAVFASSTHSTFISAITVTNGGLLNTNACILGASVSFDGTNYVRLSTWKFDTNVPSQKTFQLSATNVPIYFRLIIDGSQSGSSTNNFNLGGQYGN